MTSFFKKRAGGGAASVHMTEAEAALAQSDFNIEKISEIQNKFTGGAVLLVPGRIFIREGLLWKVCRKGPKRRQFFLFNDVLVYGSIVASRYSNQQLLPLSQMTVSAECQYEIPLQVSQEGHGEVQLDMANAFQISHASKSFHVFALSSADKSNWLTNLSKHIGKAITAATGVHTRPVWVPDSVAQNCMVCSQHFSTFVRKHHCRRCGRIVCSSCSPHRLQLGSKEAREGKLERACRECFKSMLSPLKSTKDSPPGGDSDKTSPPPPAVAAQLVSNMLRSKSQGAPRPLVRRPPPEDNSTDTEDSDDSGGEEGGEGEGGGEVKGEESARGEEPGRAVKQERSNSSPKMSVAKVGVAMVGMVDVGVASKSPVVVPEHQPTPPPRKKRLKKQQQQRAAMEAERERGSGQTTGEEGKGEVEAEDKGGVEQEDKGGVEQERGGPQTEEEGKQGVEVEEEGGIGKEEEEEVKAAHLPADQTTEETAEEEEEAAEKEEETEEKEEVAAEEEVAEEKEEVVEEEEGPTNVPQSAADALEGGVAETVGVGVAETVGVGVAESVGSESSQDSPAAERRTTCEGESPPKKGRRRRKHFAPAEDHLPQPPPGQAMPTKPQLPSQAPLATEPASQAQASPSESASQAPGGASPKVRARGRRQKFKAPDTAD